MADNKATILDFNNPVRFCEESGKDRGDANLLKQVGARALKLRKHKKLSRRELSERSDISMRYLAQLEAGEGNISLALLGKLSVALDVSLLAFLTDQWNTSEELEQFLNAFETADSAARRVALDTLRRSAHSGGKAQRVCLLGLRGAGKSTLGKRIARELDVPFMELNSQIESAAGMPVGEIIALYGQNGYRKLEAETLAHIVNNHRRIVLAAAGGIVDDPASFEQLLASCHTIWVKASPAEHMERVRQQGDMRPMAGNPEAMDQLREILTAREDSYRRADHQLDTSGKSIESSLQELRDLMRQHQVIEVSTS